MISIVICSRDKAALEAVSLDVQNSIGVPYEIVPIDNSQGQYSIFQAYNLGIKESKGDILCFMHEDIAFETIGWGGKVVEAFQAHPNLGLLGIAGASYKSSFPSGWSFAEARVDTVYMNIIQHQKSKKPPRTFYNNPRNEPLSKVASVDGVWFCTTRAVVENITFDEATFDNFHCYDIDFSLSVLQKYDVAVTFEVLLHHFSGGSFNDSWLKETVKLHNKWNHVLPINVDNITLKAQGKEEFKAFHDILPRLVGKQELSMSMLRAIWQAKARNLVGVKRFVMMNLLLIKKGLQRRPV